MNTKEDESVSLGEIVEAKPGKSRGAAVAVRLSAELLERINEYAQARGMTVSDVLRRGAERLVSGGVPAGPVYYTGLELRGPGLIHGSPATGSARSRSQSRGPAIEEQDELSITVSS
jgi:hypothetical protein